MDVSLELLRFGYAACFEVREGCVGWRLQALAFVLVELMLTVGNCLGTEGVAALGQSLTALTALRVLDLSGKAGWFGIFLVVFFEVREGVLCDACCRELSWSRWWHRLRSMVECSDIAADAESEG